MRKAMVVLLATVLVVSLAGCAGMSSQVFNGGTPVGGWVYTDVTAPSQRLHAPLNKEATALKVGKATAISVLGIVAIGNASIDRAMKNGHITKINHIDHKVMSVLGIYAEWTVIVYGE